MPTPSDVALSSHAKTLLGGTIYCWGARDQTQLLIQCIGPLVRRLREEGAIHRSWFSRFDARGPHIFFVLTPAPGAIGAVEAIVSTSVRTHLDFAPSQTALASGELVSRHAACRGREQGVMDSEPGLADNNTFFLRAHAPDGYPFVLSSGVAAPDELWTFVDALGLWAIDRLAASNGGAAGTATATAARWIRAFDGALIAAGHEPEGYWRYHASTLMIALDNEMRGEHSRDRLLTLVGGKNRATLSQLWRVEPQRTDWEPAPSHLVKIAFVGGTASMAARRRLVREVVHNFFGQLGLPVTVELPLILFAWLCGEGTRGSTAPGAGG